MLIPFHLKLHLIKDGSFMKGTYRIIWLGHSLYRGDISPPEISETREPAGETEAAEKMHEPQPEPEKTDLSPIPTELDSKKVIDALPALACVLMGMVNSVKIERLSCIIALGLSDPADTAAVSGYLWAVLSALGCGKAEVSIEPSFDRPRLDGSFLTELQARMLWTAIALLRALREEKIRSLAWDMATGARS
ncbi:MAG: DUF2953 domain-containing protein [Methanotrichaceae archaeon]|nr:DUF2953 domain-containing protein [Methanotrichaceae archaeon]